MNTVVIKDLILSTLSSYGSALLVILGAVIGIGVAYLVFRFGWRKVKTSLGDGTPVTEFISRKRQF